MKAFALVAAGAAVIGLGACTDGSRPDAARGNDGSRTLTVPVSCGQQYRSWNEGDGKGLMGALDAVSSAATAGKAHGLTGALRHARPAVAKAARHPIPACADPRGYWSALLMHVNAAVAGNSSASSVRAALDGVPKIHRQLVTEVKQTAD